LVAPAFEGYHFERSEEMPLAFIIEAFAIVVHHYAVEVTPNDCVRLLGTTVDEFAMRTIWAV